MQIPDFSKLKPTITIEDLLQKEYLTFSEVCRITNIKKTALNFYCNKQLIPYRQSKVAKLRLFKTKETLQLLSIIHSMKQKNNPIALIQIKVKEYILNNNIKI